MTFTEKLPTILPAERIKIRPIDLYAYASDASHFYLIPKAVVQPVSETEIQQLFAFSKENKIHLTFRAGGTSLSGQAVTDGILVELSRHWRHIAVENNGLNVRLQPAVIGGNVNIALRPFGRKMGPDPASINAAMMGGILSNNSSGMCCGVAQNAYHTLKYLKFILPNGLIFNTENKEDYTRFEKETPEIAEGLTQLRNRIMKNTAISDRIRHKYQQKNTTGYGINAFLDYEHPLDILAHLMIGAEGTLGFIAEAVLDTVPDLPHKMTGMLYFENPVMACTAIAPLKNAGAAALEFMDGASLRSIEHMAGVPDFVKNLPLHAAAILCEFQENTATQLDEIFEKAQGVLGNLKLLMPAHFTKNADMQALYWKIRKGMYPSVASVRASGTATMLEDLTFPVDRLGQAIVDVQHLFQKHGYVARDGENDEGIIFGHAKDGNLHFCISQSFATEEEITRFKNFNDDLFELVLKKYDGALKGEHGTGRAVAPYVEAEWGQEAYAIMKELKILIDPDNLLNPGVIITEDKNAHLSHLKIMPIVEQEVDKCVECGYCERRCPSRDFTMTPRQRIGIRRALKRLDTEGGAKVRESILKDYAFDGVDTCAVDGMCATDCPVDINTGELIKRLRRENHSLSANKWALKAAKNFALLENTIRWSLKTGFALNGFFGDNFMKKLTRVFKKSYSGFPLWNQYMGFPPPASAFVPTQPVAVAEMSAVYFSSCISRMMGGDIVKTFQNVCRKADIRLVTPDNVSGSCCGQIFSSKGFAAAYQFKANEAIEKAWLWSHEGALPIVMDVTSCTQYLQTCRPHLSPENQVRYDALRFMDSIDFAANVLLPRLKITKKKKAIVFHPVCSVQKMGLMPQLQTIGHACTEIADIPIFAGCCGMAGDRGFYYPELTQAATRMEATEVNQKSYDGYYSSAKPCEMSLSEAVGQTYQSVLCLLDEVSEG